MMKKLFKLLIMLLITTFFVNCIPTTRAQAYSWYCKRAEGNKQPPLPSEFSFINGHNVLWMNTSRKDEGKKVAYLTFDAGYENGNVAKILDVLREKKAVGAFFILENLIERNPDIVLRMYNEGHYVCNHTSTHKDVSRFKSKEEFDAEVDNLSRKYKDLTGAEMRKYFRPPEGRFSDESLNFADSSGYKTVFWSFAYADWNNDKQPSEEYAKRKIFDNIHNGCVLLLHPTSAVNAKILGEVIDHMRNEGYEFGTLDDLFNEMCK